MSETGRDAFTSLFSPGILEVCENVSGLFGDESFIETIGGPNSEHFLIMDKYDEFITCLRDGCSAVELGAKLRDLFIIMQVHFISEEMLMKCSNYPGHDSHKRHHRYFVTTIEGLINSKASPKDAMERLIVFFPHWLLGHILTADREYEEFNKLLPSA